MFSSFATRIRYLVGVLLVIGITVILISSIRTNTYTGKGKILRAQVLHHDLRPRSEDIVRKMIEAYRIKTAKSVNLTPGRLEHKYIDDGIYNAAKSRLAMPDVKPVKTMHDFTLDNENKTQRIQLHPARGVPVKSGKYQKNECLQLAPSVYIRNEARTFNADELNITQYKDKEPLIPRIIHQTWNSYNIPKPAVPFVKSVLSHHPEWEYWFWTQEDIQCYMKSKHPEYSPLYNDYNAMIFKTDVMRYFLLYDYGGFYLDLDVEALKPLDIWTHMSGCILSHETYEHTFYGHMRKQPNVMTTILATRARHPYYKLLQENLAEYHQTCPKNVLYSTGPFYIDNIYQLHVQTNNMSLEENDITVIHPRYWLPCYAGGTTSRLQQGCRSPTSRQNRTPQQKEFRLCEIAEQRGYKNVPFEDSYLNHYWMNTNVPGSKFLTKDTVDIRTLVPNLRKVSDILGLDCS